VRLNPVALVLGTSPKVDLWDNPFFVGRIDAAAALYHAGKVQHLLVSGDNGRRTYDEPSAMRDALIAQGVPAKSITLDYAGFRTLDSMARAHAVFGLTRCTIVSDDFHLPRSIYLAQAHGIDAVGFASRPVPWKWAKKTRIREIASRVAAWIDVSILRTKPKFYGPKVEIPVSDAV
jgi:SanA protein